MIKLISSLLIALFFLGSMDKIDFGSNGNSSNWRVVNDGVMGGLSQSTAIPYEDYILFSGTTSLQNNGGFVSYRSPYMDYNLEEYDAVEIKFKSTGRSFYFQLDAYRAWWYPNYKHAFSSDSNEWTTVQLPLKDFKEYRIGEQTGKKMPQSQLNDILQLGIILFDKKQGPFELQIDYIKFIAL